MSVLFQYKKDIIEIGRRLYQKGFVASHEGNISIRVSENEILATATGVCKGFLGLDDIVLVDRDGSKTAGRGVPSSELKMHLLVYEKRPDVRAVVHAHPAVATGFAVAGIPLAQCILPEVVVSLGSVPVAAYGTPSTNEVCDAISPYVEKSEAFLLANHGVATLGEDVFQAYYRMETVEHFARILLTARLLGNVNVLSPEQVEKLIDLRRKAGVLGRLPDCESCRYCGVQGRTISQAVRDMFGRGLPYSSGQIAWPGGAGATDGDGDQRASTDRASDVPSSSSPDDKELIDLITSVIREITQGK